MKKKKVNWYERKRKTNYLYGYVKYIVKTYKKNTPNHADVNTQNLNYPPRIVVVFTFHGLNRITDIRAATLTDTVTEIANLGLKCKRHFYQNKARYQFTLPFDN